MQQRAQIRQRIRFRRRLVAPPAQHAGEAGRDAAFMALRERDAFEAVEFATLEWVDWFNNRRLLEPIGNIPPAEAEQRYYAQKLDHPIAA